MAIPFITAEEAASHIENGFNVGLSGFTASGTPKIVTEAVAAKAERLHAEGKPFQINIFTGASTNDHVDGALSRAGAINLRTPYQGSAELRKHINIHEVHYFDLHLSELAQKFRYGTFGKLNVAIIEAAAVDDDGSIVLGTGLGKSETPLAAAVVADEADGVYFLVGRACCDEHFFARKLLMLGKVLLQSFHDALWFFHASFALEV